MKYRMLHNPAVDLTNEVDGWAYEVSWNPETGSYNLADGSGLLAVWNLNFGWCGSSLLRHEIEGGTVDAAPHPFAPGDPGYGNYTPPSAQETDKGAPNPSSPIVEVRGRIWQVVKLPEGWCLTLRAEGDVAAMVVRGPRAQEYKVRPYGQGVLLHPAQYGAGDVEYFE